MSTHFKFVAPALLVAALAYSGAALAQSVAQPKTSAAPAAAAATIPASGAVHPHAGKKEAEDGDRDVSPKVEAAQEALNKSGAALKVDGVMGPATRAAIKRFQASHQLKANGRLDKATTAALEGHA